MLIPVKCFTCGKVLGDKYRYYKEEVKKMKTEQGNTDEGRVVYLTKANKEKTPEGKIMDKLNLNKICCRRHILTHVDIE